MTAAEGLAAEGSAARAGVALGTISYGLQAHRQLRDRSELHILAAWGPDQLRLGLVDGQLAVLHLVAERRCATHPPAFLFGCGDLVADALAGDLALELSE